MAPETRAGSRKKKPTVSPAGFFSAHKNAPNLSHPRRILLSQQPAGLPIEKMQPCAGWADDPLIFVFSHVIVFVQPMLDANRCCRAGEDERGHLSEYDGPETLDHDVAQVPAGTAKPGLPRFLRGGPNAPIID